MMLETQWPKVIKLESYNSFILQGETRGLENGICLEVTTLKSLNGSTLNFQAIYIYIYII